MQKARSEVFALPLEVSGPRSLSTRCVRMRSELRGEVKPHSLLIPASLGKNEHLLEMVAPGLSGGEWQPIPEHFNKHLHLVSNEETSSPNAADFVFAVRDD